MATYKYTPRGVCSRQISFDIEDGKLYGVSFEGGWRVRALKKRCAYSKATTATAGALPAPISWQKLWRKHWLRTLDIDISTNAKHLCTV